MTALNELAEAIFVGIDSVHDIEVTFTQYADAAAREVLKTLPALVKPLVWEARSVNTDTTERRKRGAIALTPFEFFYVIAKRRGGNWELFTDNGNAIVQIGSHPTEESAKAAANAHHVAQVMAALDIQQIGERDEPA